LELLRHRRRGGGRRGGFSMATGMDRARAPGACSPWGRSWWRSRRRAVGASRRRGYGRDAACRRADVSLRAQALDAARAMAW